MNSVKKKLIWNLIAILKIYKLYKIENEFKFIEKNRFYWSTIVASQATKNN